MSEDDMPKGAEKVTGTLDLLTDEPLELALALEKLAKIKAAGGSNRKEWQRFASHAEDLVAALEELNEVGGHAASQKHDKDEASEKEE
jgi:hypothetical protein